VLVLTQHYAPEVTAGRFRVEAFAEALAGRGHEVLVICPVPNHPRGVVQPGYGRRLVEHRTVGAVEVAYVRVAVSPEKTFRTRLAYYGSYAAMAAAVGSVQGRPAAILASSPPLTVGAAGALLAARYRAPLVVDIRDVWPDSAVNLGELTEGRALSLMRRLERFVYSRADSIITANDAFRSRIEMRAPAATPVEVVPNGTTQPWLRLGEVEVSRTSVGLPEDRFVWAYAGNVGLAHGLEHAAAAAGALGDDYLLVVIGEGPRYRDLARQAAEDGSATIELRGLMEPAEAARHLRAADALLVSERQSDVVSAKLYDVCALGRPVVCACRGEMRRLVEREGIALAVPHGDPEALAAGVRRLRAEPDLARALVERSRAFAAAHLRERQAERLADVVESVSRPR
jgi:glycosyltransferase involved in cell wall biosynthesis